MKKMDFEAVISQYGELGMRYSQYWKMNICSFKAVYALYNPSAKYFDKARWDEAKKEKFCGRPIEIDQEMNSGRIEFWFIEQPYGIKAKTIQFEL